MKFLAKATVAWFFLGLPACGGVNFGAGDGAAATSNTNQNSNNTIPPLLCSAGQPATSVNYFPTNCLVNPGLSAAAVGVEINNGDMANGKVFSIPSDDQVHGTGASTSIYIEVATYLQPDSIVITAYHASGGATQILNICDIGTYSAADPTGGIVRPYSDTILQFNVTLPKGTTKITFDYTGSDSPTYVGIWNLNEFHTALNSPATNPFYGTSWEQMFRVQTGPLSVFNTGGDPLGPNQSCP
jgi:hypothetical protein